MQPGQSVKVNWRDAIVNSGEPNRARPGVVVSAPRSYDPLPFELVVALTGTEHMALEDASVRIDPTSENGCTKISYALSWNVQCVVHVRLTETASRITDEELDRICKQSRRASQDRIRPWRNAFDTYPVPAYAVFHSWFADRQFRSCQPFVRRLTRATDASKTRATTSFNERTNFARL